ncbi:MAG: hypothetical protein ACTHO8_05130 [Solirubrobacterales bacterium]
MKTGDEGGELEGPLFYNAGGAGVQNSPKIYPIFWGSNWGTAPGAELREELLTFYRGLSGSAYQGTLTQYFDGSGNISSTVAVATPYTDSTAATLVTQGKIEEEVSKAITVNGWPREFDGQYAVFTSPGSTFAESFTASPFCAYHSYTGTGVSYSFVPYQGDPPFSTFFCQESAEHSARFSTVVAATHEYAEAATDPVPGETTHAWMTSGARRSEIADICDIEGTFRLPDGAWAQDQFDNARYECVREDPNPPHVYAATEGASSASGSEATLTGLVNSEGASTKYFFEYGTTMAYGSRTSEQAAASGISTASQVAGGLAAGTIYHYRVVATNATGSMHGIDRTVKTAAAPTIESAEAARITPSEAHFRGFVNPNGSATSYHVEYGPTAAYGTSAPVPSGQLGFGRVGVGFEFTVRGLLPETTYHFRLVAENGVGVTRSEDKTFITGKGSAPTVATGVAEAFLSSDEVYGTVNPNGLPTTYQFEYGTSKAYGSAVPMPAEELGSGVEAISVSQEIRGLANETTYHYRLVATNAAGTSFGEDREFTTVERPQIVTEAASQTNTLEPQLNGSVNPEGFETTYQFEYGLSESYGSKVPVKSEAIGAFETFIAVSAPLKGLQRGATYHYRLVASNAVGTNFGADKTLTTLPLCQGGSETCSWTQQTSANPPATSGFSLKDASCASATLCLAPGWDVGKGKSFLDLWNGSEWSIASSSLGQSEFEGEMKQLACPTAKLCIGVGSTPSGGLQGWKVTNGEGSHWTPLATKAPPVPTGGTEAKLKDVSCSSETACTAVGSYRLEGAYKPLVESWNGSEWSLQSAPAPAESGEKTLQAVSCASSTFCMAVGEGASKPVVERWNGSEWSLGSASLPSGAAGGGLAAVSCASSISCTAVGNFREGTRKSLVEAWNGSSWSLQSAPNVPEREGTLLNGVSCLSASSCFAVGESWKTVLSPAAKTVAESWNGTEWSLQSTPNPTGSSSSPLVAVSCTSSIACTAVGSGTPGSTGEQSGTLALRLG